MEPVIVREGAGPLVLGFPHAGTYVPDEIYAALNDEGRILRDTDWHIDTLYADLLPNVTTVQATFHRYVIDANRDPSGQSLYPGQTTTGLVPLTTFDNMPIWRAGRAPDDPEITRRLEAFHAPYHEELQRQLDRVKAQHGFAILYDCHSIRSIIPWLFDGTLPDFNIGTDGGRTCAPEIEAAVHQVCEQSGRSTVLNGRFRGGWTTRKYGQPGEGVHAIQMELAQTSYLARETPPFDLSPERCATMRSHLTEILAQMLQAATALRQRHEKEDMP